MGQAPGHPPPAAAVGMCVLSGQLTATLQHPMGSLLFSFSPPPARSRLQETTALRGARQGVGRGAEDLALIIQMQKSEGRRAAACFKVTAEAI